MNSLEKLMSSYKPTTDHKFVITCDPITDKLTATVFKVIQVSIKNKETNEYVLENIETSKDQVKGTYDEVVKTMSRLNYIEHI